MSATPPRPEALLVAEDLRVDVDGVPVCDGLAFRTNGEHVLVLGAPRVLFDAATGLARIARGVLTLGGVSATVAAARGVVAGAAQDPPLPPRWTVLEYVQWSARLAGVPADEARASALGAISRLQLDPLAKTETSRLVPHARRATVVAGALATGAGVIALDDPLGGLPDDASAAYASVLASALEGRAWVVFAPRMPLSSPLAERADEAIVATALRVEAQGTPADLARAERFVARFEGPVDAAMSLLRGRGAKVQVQGAHVLLELGRELSTSELFAICSGVDVSVIELAPVARALT